LIMAAPICGWAGRAGTDIGDDTTAEPWQQGETLPPGQSLLLIR
jgi:hypothetical protein